MDEAALCDRIGLINEGRLIACDRFDALLARTKNRMIEELFFESEASGL